MLLFEKISKLINHNQTGQEKKNTLTKTEIKNEISLQILQTLGG